MTKINIDELINNMVDDYHNSDTELEIFEYLGITQEEYRSWVKNPDNLPNLDYLDYK